MVLRPCKSRNGSHHIAGGIPQTLETTMHLPPEGPGLTTFQSRVVASKLFTTLKSEYFFVERLTDLDLLDLPA